MGIKIDLEECCYKCEQPRLEMRESTLCALYGGVTKEVIIKCENTRICKYLEQLKEQKHD